MIKHIPNTVTLLASLFGVLATSFAFQGNLHWAGYCILAAAVCDFFDGFLARLLHAKSAIGADLDSLADVVSFGVAPSAIAYQLLATMLPEHLAILAFGAFLIVPFSALRLAIFNNSTDQTTSFVGLPVPAHAMLWVGLAFLPQHSFDWCNWTHHFYHWYILLSFVVLFSLLLVSKLPLFSLKGNVLKNKLLWLFFALSLLLLYLFHLGGLFFILIIYIMTGFANLYLKKV